MFIPELKEIQFKLKAPKNQFNSFSKFKYRSCEDILEALKPLLNEYECTLTISDAIKNIGDRYYIEATATLTNKEGNSFSVTALSREDDTKKGMDASQITGSASSYARKYALNGLFCIDDSKDADTMKPEEKPIKQILSEQRKSIYDLASKNRNLFNNICDRYAVGQLEDLTDTQIIETFDAMRKIGRL